MKTRQIWQIFAPQTNRGMKSSGIRNSNIELIRLVAMLLIVLYHASGIVSPFTNRSFVLQVESIVIGIWGIFGVDLFLIISCWFLVERKFHIKNIISLIFHMASYILFFFLLWIVIQVAQGNSYKTVIKDIIEHIAKEIISPLWARDYWFITAYLIISIVSPLINRLLSSIDNVLLRKILILFSFIPIYANFQGGQATVVDVLFFLYAYLIVAYIKRNIKEVKKVKFRFFITLIVIQILFYSFYSFTSRESILGQVSGFLYYFFGNVGRYSIITAFSSFVLFLWVIDKPVKEYTSVNRISKHNLGVYFFHDNQLVKIVEVVFGWTISNQLFSKSPILFPIEYVAIGVVIMISGLLVEAFRYHFIQRPFDSFINRKCNILFEKCDRWINMELPAHPQR